jgi:hypothetical protein
MKIVFKELLLVGLLAAFGGFINTLACKPKDETYSWKRAMPEIAIAIFAGLLIHWLLKDFDISDNYRIMSVALAGYSARGVLNIFNRLFLDHIKNVKLMWLFGACVCLVLLSGCISDIAGKTTIEEYDAAGKLVKRTTTGEPIIEQIVASTKDKTCILLRENFIVGLIASPVSEASNSVFSLQAIYAHKKLSIATIHKDHTGMIPHLPNMISAMNKMTGVSLSPTGISNTPSSAPASDTSDSAETLPELVSISEN